MISLTPLPACGPALPAQPIVNSIGMTFVPIQPGDFVMGSPDTEEWRRNDETQHKVRITTAFYLQTTEVTQQQWQAVMGNNPSKFKGDNLPVESVSWDDAVAFCDKLRDMECKRYRLPTEAEWEYACRAGSTGPCAGTGRLDDMGWHHDNAGEMTHPVAMKQANAWGLYDMHGNVFEWCADWYDFGSNPAVDPVADPKGPATGSVRVSRGGSWFTPPAGCRSASGCAGSPAQGVANVGFRVVLESR